ncbi:peptidoglycan-binding domain-containing protein [Yoonia sp. 208BN28-4]|uniref:peptidoglycan-binding domain-containing protein n=1 Tax=Yoonia sp. 208BN28-4 TaxID=3126505 RepID=UPI0030A4317F
MRQITLMAMIAAGPAWADEALVLGNARYVELDQLVGADAIDAPVDALAAAGFDVTQSTNATGSGLRDAVQGFAAGSGDSDRLVAALMGQFATDGDRTWFLPVDTGGPSLFALEGAVSLESVLQVMVGPQGQSVLALGYDAAENAAYDTYLREGVGTLTIPQGVTVVTGDPSDIADFVQAAAAPGADLMALVQDDRGLRVQGYAPEQLVLVAAQTQTADPPADDPIVDPSAEQALWDGARALDTLDAYRNYLTRYPQGQFASEAQDLIAEIETEPNRPARLAEEALDLTRAQRREVQQNLTVLNFDPRGIDGIFGAGSRSAILNWQQQNGYAQTTFLTAEQITRLDAQAARRTAELEAERERARQEELRLDRAYWDETGAQGDAPGLRAYLARYPNGTYASQAQDLLNAMAETARAQDNAAWAAAQEANTQDSYAAYLEAYPEGINASAARAEIRALQSPADVAEETAREQALGLNAITLRLVEARLGQIGLDPGNVDGTFDAQTREAIASFQQNRSLDATGYLDEVTVARLLAEGIQSLADQ